MWIVATKQDASGRRWYLDDNGEWTSSRAAARRYKAPAGAGRAMREARRRTGMELQVLGPPPRRRQEPRTEAQEEALELARGHGGLVRAGAAWRPLGARAPALAAGTVASLVRRGDLALTEEGRDRFGKRRWLRVAPGEGQA